MRPKRRRFVPRKRWLYPAGVEREYQRFAKKLLRAAYDATMEELDSIKSLAATSALRKDDINDDIFSIIERIKRRFQSKADQLRFQDEIKRIGSMTSNFNNQQFRDVMRSAVRVDVFQHEPWLRDLLSVWTQENVRLISKDLRDYFGDLEGIISRGLMDGRLNADLAKDIADRFGIADRRAQLIARDQVGGLNGDLTEYRQTSVGIRSYVWRTSRDAKVRDSHRSREGKVYTWDKPPAGGKHPGKEIHCRCTADPVIDLDELNINIAV